MAPLETATASETEQLRQETVETAKTSGDYVEGLKKTALDLERGSSSIHERLAHLTQEERRELIQAVRNEASTAQSAMTGNQDLAIDQTLKGTEVNGNAVVNGGRRSVRLSPDAVKKAGMNAKGKNAFINLAGHETAHAEDQKIMGEVVANKKISGWHLHEMHAEQEGALEEGKSIHEKREGQPADYAEAQEMGKELEAFGVLKAQFDKRIAEGDTVGLQADIIRGGMGKGSLAPADIARNLQTGGQTYAQAIRRVIEGDARETPQAMAA